MKFAILGAALALSVTQLLAQGSGTPDSFAVQAHEASLAPLSLLTNGPGRIVPFEDGQILQVGRDYTMAAVAEPGFEFDHWTAVNVFTFTEYYIDPSGGTHIIITKVFSATPFHSDERVLEFTMQPTGLIYNDPGSASSRAASDGRLILFLTFGRFKPQRSEVTPNNCSSKITRQDLVTELRYW